MGVVSGLFLVIIGVAVSIEPLLPSALRTRARQPLAIAYLIVAVLFGPWGALGLLTSALSGGLLRYAPLLWATSLATSAVEVTVAVLSGINALGKLRTDAGSPGLTLKLQLAAGISCVLLGVLSMVLALIWSASL